MKNRISPLISIVFLAAAMVVGCVSGCNTTGERAAANTISSIDILVTGTVDNYYMAAIKGMAPKEGIPKVGAAYNQFHKDLIVAIDLSQGNTNELAPNNLKVLAAGVLSAVAEAKTPNPKKLKPATP